MLRPGLFPSRHARPPRASVFHAPPRGRAPNPMSTTTKLSPARSLLALSTLLAAGCGGGGGHSGSGAGAPSSLRYPTAETIYVVDLASGVLAPSVAGVVDRFTVLPPLPAGLAFDEHTGAISGSATLVAARRSYTITAANAHGSASTTLELTVAPAPRFAYALSGADATITVFGVDLETGRLAPKGYEPAPAGASGGEQLCVHPSEAFLYASNTGSDAIAVYAVDPLEGWLSARGTTPAGPGPHRMVLHPSGRFAFVVSMASSELFVFDVDAVTGELVHARAPISVGTRPVDVTLDPEGRFLFVAFAGALGSGGGAGVQGYSIDSANGAVTPSGARVPLDGLEPSGLRVDPARNAVYVTLAQSDSVLPMRYHQTTGALAALTPDAAGDKPEALVFDPLGRFGFVANKDGSSVSSYKVDGPSGQLIPSGTAATGSQPSAVAIDTAGRFLYVANHGSGDVMLFRVGAEDGALEEVDLWSVRSSPVDLAIVRGARAPIVRTRSLHAVNGGSSDVSSFALDAATGAATERHPTSPTSVDPAAIAVHPRHAFAYVAERGAQSLGTYRVDAASGALSPLGPATHVAGVPWHVTIEPSGRFLYLLRRDVVLADDGWLSTYAIDVTDGSLHFVDERAVGGRPVFAAVDPTGRFLVVANIGAPSELQSFRLDAATGVPSTAGAAAPAPGVHALAFHPGGRELVAVLRTSNTLVRYALDPETGAPSAIAGGSRAGREPVAFAYSADGRFACAAYADTNDDEDGGHVTLFRVDANGTLVTPGLAYHDGLHPSALAISPSGRHVYVTNAGSNTLSSFALDPTSGTLQPLPSTTTGLAPRALTLTAETR